MDRRVDMADRSVDMDGSADDLVGTSGDAGAVDTVRAGIDV